MTWFTLAGLVIALTAAVAAGAFADWWRRHIVDVDPYPPDKDAAMRAARQRHPANRVTCVHCGEQVTGPTAEHICGMPS